MLAGWGFRAFRARVIRSDVAPRRNLSTLSGIHPIGMAWHGERRLSSGERAGRADGLHISNNQILNWKDDLPIAHHTQIRLHAQVPLCPTG